MFKNPVFQSAHELQNNPSKAAADEIERRNRMGAIYAGNRAAYLRENFSPQDARSALVQKAADDRPRLITHHYHETKEPTIWDTLFGGLWKP